MFGMCTCFSYTQPTMALALQTGIALKNLEPKRQRSHIYPTEPAIVLLRRQEVARIEPAEMTWGLVPSWAQDTKIGRKCVNARSETVWEKPAFREAMRRRRCVVPANAFYEWSGVRGRKERWRFQPRGEENLLLAGLWECWMDAARHGAGSIRTFTILTQAAAPPVEGFHDRQPVMLHPADLSTWLDPEARHEDLREILAATGNVDLDWMPDRAVAGTGC